MIYHKSTIIAIFSLHCTIDFYIHLNYIIVKKVVYNVALFYSYEFVSVMGITCHK